MNRGNTVSTSPSLPGNNSQPSNEVLRSISPQHFSTSALQHFSTSVIQWFSDSVIQWFSDSVLQCFSAWVLQCFSVSVFQCFSASVLQWLSASLEFRSVITSASLAFIRLSPLLTFLMPWMLWMLLQFVLHTTPWYTRCRRGYTVKRDLLGEVLHYNPFHRLCRACWPAKRFANCPKLPQIAPINIKLTSNLPQLTSN